MSYPTHLRGKDYCMCEHAQMLLDALRGALAAFDDEDTDPMDLRDIIEDALLQHEACEHAFESE